MNNGTDHNCENKIKKEPTTSSMKKITKTKTKNFKRNVDYPSVEIE